MTVALDLGCREFRSLRRQGQRLVARRVAAAYCVVDDQPAQRRFLEQIGVPILQVSGSLLVIGDAAHDVSHTLRRPVIPVLSDGQVPADDPIGRQLCRIMIESLIPSQNETPARCVLNLPAAESRLSTSPSGTTSLLESIVQLHGYTCERVHAGTALVLAELEDRRFTGIGLSVGAESVQVSLMFAGSPVVEISFQRGARNVERRYASRRHRYLWDDQGNRYLDIEGIRRWEESGELSLNTPRSGDEQELASLYRHLLDDALSAMFVKMIGAVPAPLERQPLTLVISGGPVQLPGFRDVLAASLSASRLRLKIEEIRQASSDPYSIARGLLVQGSLTQTQIDYAASRVA